MTKFGATVFGQWQGPYKIRSLVALLVEQIDLREKCMTTQNSKNLDGSLKVVVKTGLFSENFWGQLVSNFTVAPIKQTACMDIC